MDGRAADQASNRTRSAHEHALVAGGDAGPRASAGSSSPRRASAPTEARGSSRRSGPRRRRRRRGRPRSPHAALAGRSESAWRNRKTSPVALPAPAFICDARPGGCNVRTIGEQARDQQRRVAAPAVDHDDLVALRAQRLQCGKRCRDARGLVESGNDDRQAINPPPPPPKCINGCRRRMRWAVCGRAASIAGSPARAPGFDQTPMRSNLRELVITESGRNAGARAAPQELRTNSMSSVKKRSGTRPRATNAAAADETGPGRRRTSAGDAAPQVGQSRR